MNDDITRTDYDLGTRWTHKSGAFVELIHDDDPGHPLDDVEGVALAFREGDHYNGTAADYPRYPFITCPSCVGSGEQDDTDCLRCQGAGDLDADLETYFRVERGATAIHAFDTGNYGEASAVMYVTDDGWTDPAAAAKAWADEYQSWSEGDVWGIVYGGPGIAEESVWGFIGYDYAQRTALEEFLPDAIEATRVEAVERAACEARDIITA